METSMSKKECQHNTISFTFSTGETIARCTNTIPVKYGPTEILEPCTLGDEHRQRVLANIAPKPTKAKAPKKMGRAKKAKPVTHTVIWQGPVGDVSYEIEADSLEEAQEQLQIMLSEGDEESEAFLDAHQVKEAA